MANLNPSQRYAYGMSFVPEGNETYGTVPVPKRTGGISIPGAPNQEAYRGTPYVQYAPGNEQYNFLPTETATSSGMPTWGWVAIAAAGGLVLLYMLK